MEKQRKTYTAPVSEMLAMAAQDVITTSLIFDLDQENALTWAGGFWGSAGPRSKRGRWVFGLWQGKWQWYWRRW